MKNRIYTAIFVTGLFILNSIAVSGQDLDALLEKEVKPEKILATATFKSTRIVNGHSIERMKKRQLEFRISHRFDQLNTGASNLYGLDYGKIHFALEYGLTDWLEIGVGRGSEDKTFDGFGKVSILRQSSGAKFMPVHLSYLSSAEYVSSNLNPLMTTSASRMSFVQQLLIARKFNESLSLQLSPTFIHRNQVPLETDKNDLFALGAGARYKISKRIALNVEYFYVYRANAGALPVTYHNPLGIGIDIETGGHVFQIMLTNSQSMREAGFIGKTTGNWGDGGIHLGFNISRVFSFNK
jgi:hypothetical protein